MIPREALIAAATRIFRSYGFAPIDTPALEYLDVLSGKGSEETDKQLYRFTDHGGRDVAPRGVLTVLARFSAQHIEQLGMPFKRYHLGKVWRGENTQAGRYREFMQCDFDTIGTRSVAADIETALVIHDLVRGINDVSEKWKNKPFERFSIRVNNRMILNGLLEKVGLTGRSVPVLRALDKLPKIGAEKVAEEMTKVAGATPEQIDGILKLATLKGSNEAILASLAVLLRGNELGEEGVRQLGELVETCEAAGISEEHLVIDVSIARGLDYYTGTIFETFLTDLPNIGSVCSGGRYDNLAALYTNRELPGIGASLGLDRLFSAMEQLGIIESRKTTAEIFIPWFAETLLGDYLRLAAELRRAGFAVEVYLEPKKLGAQLKYADKKGFLMAVIRGESEFDAGTARLKNLKSGESREVSIENIVEEIAGQIRPCTF